MKLIMVEKYISTRAKFCLAKELNGKLADFDYDGCSTKEIEQQLQQESADVVVVSADSRMMQYVREEGFFNHNNTYIYRNGEFRKVQDTTRRILRPEHNMMRLYESGEFEF